jgi:hypothetical protein
MVLIRGAAKRATAYRSLKVVVCCVALACSSQNRADHRDTGSGARDAGFRNGVKGVVPTSNAGDAGPSRPIAEAGTQPSLDAQPDTQLDATTDLGVVDASHGPSQHPVSKFCGDAIRDPVSEECDDGPGNGDDSCTSDCRARSMLVVAPVNADSDAGFLPGPRRELGTGSHASSGGDQGFAVVYLEQETDTHLFLQAFDESGARRGTPLDVGVGRAPVSSAGPVVSALPDGTFAAVWTERSSGTPDIALRHIVPGSSSIPAATTPHADKTGAQQDPDVLWTGQELVVAWSDRLDVKYRRYDAVLAPLAEEQPLASSNAIESNVTLAQFGSSWSAAWRSGEQGLERVRARTESVGWVTPAATPGPEGDHPALVQLDDQHLLLVFTVGTDPLSTGSASVGRLRAALLDTAAPGEVSPFELIPLTAPYSSDATLAQRRPSLARVGDQLFLAWESASPLGDARGQETWIERLQWSPDHPTTLDMPHEEPLPLKAPTDGNQENPRLGTSPLFPGGALITLWEDHSLAISGRPSPDIMLGFRPVPWVTLPPVSTGH